MSAAAPTRQPHRRILLGDQLRRRRELDAIRTARSLTADERAEDDDLAERAYQRQYQRDYRQQIARRAARLGTTSQVRA